jgi:hypothetical protein
MENLMEEEPLFKTRMGKDDMGDKAFRVGWLNRSELVEVERLRH